MANATIQVAPGEVLRVWPWARVEPFLREGVPIPGSPLDTVTAGSDGKAVLSVLLGVEYAISRTNGKYIHVLEQTAI